MENEYCTFHLRLSLTLGYRFHKHSAQNLDSGVDFHEFLLCEPTFQRLFGQPTLLTQQIFFYHLISMNFEACGSFFDKCQLFFDGALDPSLFGEQQNRPYVAM